MLAIYKKELRSYFINAIGYVYVGVFLAISAFLCTYLTLGAGTYETGNYFKTIVFSFIVLIPLLTMKLFAEEKKLRTEQLLLTAPVTVWGMVLGKFFAAVTLFVGSVLVSCINFIPLYIYSFTESETNKTTGQVNIGPPTGEIIACLIGIILIGIAFIAIGMFISSLTENQLAAAVITVAVILIMLALDVARPYIEINAINFIISWVCVLSRFSNFTQGLLDYSALVYYLSIAGVFLLLTARVYDKRRWG